MSLLWIDFVNSDCRDHLGRGPDVDRLEDPAWTREFLDQHGLPAVDLGAPATRRTLRELRTLLQQIVASCRARRPLLDAQLAALNRYLESPEVHPRLVRQKQAYRLDILPNRGGLSSIQFAIAASMAKFLVDGNPNRLKLCSNPSCRWLFYDTTRSRTRRWCAPICGSLIKVRQFRKREHKPRRQSQKGGQSPPKK